MLKMLLLSYLYNVSERQVEDLCNLYLPAKSFLGLGVDEKAPDHSTLTAFKERILENGRLAAFERLLQDIRTRTNVSKKACAEALGVSTATINAYEEGRKPISLPELEVLAYLMDVPVSIFWDEDVHLAKEEEPPPLGEILQLRQRITGALLRKARLEEAQTQQDLAEVLGCTTNRISSYEDV